MKERFVAERLAVYDPTRPARPDSGDEGFAVIAVSYREPGSLHKQVRPEAADLAVQGIVSDDGPDAAVGVGLQAAGCRVVLA
jgi:hypothetical protein